MSCMSCTINNPAHPGSNEVKTTQSLFTRGLINVYRDGGGEQLLLSLYYSTPSLSGFVSITHSAFAHIEQHGNESASIIVSLAVLRKMETEQWATGE